MSPTPINRTGPGAGAGVETDGGESGANGPGACLSAAGGIGVVSGGGVVQAAVVRAIPAISNALIYLLEPGKSPFPQLVSA